VDTYSRGDLTFDVLDEGPPGGAVVVLLHGFPQQNTSWNTVIPRLTEEGYRCLAPNQRGYSRTARPRGRWNYRTSELVADVCALIDASGAPRVHLVGHDWGAAVAWVVAASAPERLATLTALSVPHPAGFQKAVVTSRQGLASWYMFFFQLPRIPERVLLGRDGRAAGLRWLVQSKWKQTSAFADRDIAAMTEPGALTAALNWYRAIPFQDVRRSGEKIIVPTMFVWSDGDVPIVQQGVQHCARYVTGEYRFETLHDVGHFMLEQKPDAVADLLLDWISAHPVSA
jgi:pimeloyl-ACP methyl ester carboxylesterase